jgi:hypothetical protein
VKGAGWVRYGSDPPATQKSSRSCACLHGRDPAAGNPRKDDGLAPEVDPQPPRHHPVCAGRPDPGRFSSLENELAGPEHFEARDVVAGAFVHRTSRARDPQLHSHVLIAAWPGGTAVSGPSPTRARNSHKRVMLAADLATEVGGRSAARLGCSAGWSYGGVEQG